MKKQAGRFNGEVGVERVDHDGKVVKVLPADVEATPEERLNWYANCGASEEDAILVKNPRLETEYDDGGNPAWVNEKHRTSKPRPHQFSIERRLQEQRDPGSTSSYTSDATREQATAAAFAQVSTIVLADGYIEEGRIIAIADKFSLPISDIMSLKRIAKRNTGLAKRYADAKELMDENGPVLFPEEQEVHSRVPAGASLRLIPGGESLAKEELERVGPEVGL